MNTPDMLPIIAALDRAKARLEEEAFACGPDEIGRADFACGDAASIDKALDILRATAGMAPNAELQKWKDRYFERRSLISRWHNEAVALGYDGVADMLTSIQQGEPPIHIAELLARASQAMPGKKS